jgi:hypothetical protein
VVKLARVEAVATRSRAKAKVKGAVDQPA